MIGKLCYIIVAAGAHECRFRASGGMADTLVLGTSAERRRGSTPLLPMAVSIVCGSSSVVERYLAKVDVASSSLVSRLDFGLRPANLRSN